MRTTLILLLALLATPALARVTQDNGSALIEQRMTFSDALAACVSIAQGWEGVACTEQHVALGICTPDGEGNPTGTLPTVTCNAARVTAGLCRERDLTREIPAPAACALALDAWSKRALRDLAKAGYRGLDEQGRQDQEPDPVEDPAP